jgi:membrane protease YdiL (CAAX protease family)
VGAAPPGSVGPPGAAPEHAGLGRRLLAGLIDAGIGWLFVGIAVYAAVPEIENDTLTRSQEESAGIAALVALSVWVNLMVFGEWRFGRTLGKAALGIKVLRLDGTPMTWNGALVRNLLRVPDLVAIFFTVPTSEHGQRLGDRAAKTVVMRWREDALPVPPGATPNASATWGGARVLAGLALLLLITVLAAGIASAFDPDLETLGAVLVLQGLLAAAMVYVPFQVAEADGMVRPAALGLGPSFRAPVKTAVIAYLAYLACALVISTLLSPEQEDITRELGVDEGVLGAIAAFFLIVVAAPVSEEIFFRGFMFAGVRSHGSFVVAALVSAGVWGLFHYTGEDSWPVVLQLSAFGVILAWVYERTGSIRPCIALHMLNNAIAFAVLASG